MYCQRLCWIWLWYTILSSLIDIHVSSWFFLIYVKLKPSQSCPVSRWKQGTCVAHCAAQLMVSWPSSRPGRDWNAAKSTRQKWRLIAVKEFVVYGIPPTWLVVYGIPPGHVDVCWPVNSFTACYQPPNTRPSAKYPSAKYESQLGWWNSSSMEHKKCSKPPTSYITLQ